MEARNSEKKQKRYFRKGCAADNERLLDDLTLIFGADLDEKQVAETKNWVLQEIEEGKADFFK